MSIELIEDYRSISLETLKEYGVHWDDEDERYPVKVPYYHLEGEWYVRKLRHPERNDIEPKALSPKNAKPHLYNPMRLGPNTDLVFICEGEYDTLSVIDCGFPAVGTQGTQAFHATWTRLFGGATVIIALDGDESGREAAIGIRRFFLKHGDDAIIMELDEGEDLNDLHNEGLLEDFLHEFLEENGIEHDYGW